MYLEIFIYLFYITKCMKNLKVAQILYKIADLLEIQEVEFKPVAYRRAAMSIENLSDSIEDYYKNDKLKDIPGVGEGIAKKIVEIIKTGTCKEFKKLKKRVPVDFENLLKVEGVGPRTVKILYKKLKIKNLKDLEKAAKQGKISRLKDFGNKTEENILESLDFVKKHKGRFLLGDALSVAEDIKNYLLKKSKKIEIGGSLRRYEETIGDVDILAVGDKKLVEYFTKYNDVVKVLAKGPSKSSIILDTGLQVDLRLVKYNQFGAALQYFTGNKEHNIELRKLAIKKGYKLNEYGLFKGKNFVSGKTEREVYNKLGLQYIEPELRTNTGEIEVAKIKKLPNLITLKDIKGDLQVHSKWSDGSDQLKDIADYCKKLGYDYFAITDHFGSLRIANSLNRNRIRKQWQEIDKLNKGEFTILKGAEVNIKLNCSLDIDSPTLKELDYVIAAVHSGLRNNVTNRTIKAMENRYVNAIAHPSGRLINTREGAILDYEKLFDKSVETGTFFEINSCPERLDLDSVNVKSAIDKNCKLLINTDAHSVDSLNFMKFGVGTARRGWCESNGVINTFTLNKLQKHLQK